MSSPFSGDAADAKQWWPSRYGPEDRRGAANELSSAAVLRALRIPKTGRVIELGQVIPTGGSVARRPHLQTVLAHETLEDVRAQLGRNRFSSFSEQVVTTHHTGTHVDALGHVGIDGVGYGGRPYADVFAVDGLLDLGIEHAPAWVARGVVLDVEAVAGHLDAGAVITPAMLDDAAAMQGVHPDPGDVLLVHTGWSRLWGADHARYSAGEPGLGWDSAHWVTDRRVSLIGLDNWGCDAFPAERGDDFFSVHQHLITETGTYVVENITTDELVAGGHHEFLFVMAPHKAQGGTAGAAAPVAVV